jgi:hypothetical protein
MSEHKCELCNKIFTRKLGLTRHYNRKFKCNAVPNIITKKVKEDNIIDTPMDLVLNQDNKTMSDKIMELEKTITELKLVINQTNTINSNNNIGNSIYVQNFNKVIDPKEIADEVIIKIMNNGLAQIVPLLTEALHCNNSKPHLHNVYISDKRSKFLVIFNGRKYVTTLLDDALSIVDRHMKTLVETFVESLNEDNRGLTKETIERFNNKLERLNELDEGDEVQKLSNLYVKFLLFDNKDIVIETRKKYEKNNKKLIKI